MPGYDHLFGGSSSSSSSSSSNSPGHPSNQGGGGGGGGGWSPHNVPEWRKPKPPKPKPIVSNPPHQVIRDVKAEDEAKEVQHYQNWLGSTAHQGAGAGNVTWANILQDRKKSAYEASLENQQQMQQAIDLLYSGTQQHGGDWNKDKTITEGLSQFHNLTDEQKQFLIDSGLAAAESEGILGGTMGAELVMNDLKKQLQSATTNEEWQATADKLNKLLGQRDEQGNFILDDKGKPISGNTAWMYDDPKYWDDKTKSYMQSIGLYDPTKGSALGYDQSAVYSWGDVENNPFLYKAHQELGSKDLTPGQYTDYMDKISAFGHMGTAPGGTGAGGWGGGYGGGGGGSGGPGGFQYNKHAQQGIEQGPPVNPGSLQETVNQGFLSGMGTRFSRGGIVSLLRLGE